MAWLTNPTAYRLANNPTNHVEVPSLLSWTSRPLTDNAMAFLAMAPPHTSHPSLGRLVLLVFEAVLEVVCVSLPGYIVARQGMFDASAQKFVANLNVQLFTPCLSVYRPDVVSWNWR